MSPTPERPGQEPGLWRVTGDDGAILDGREPAGLVKADYVALHRWMSLVRAVDGRMLTLQRQGRISFYGSATGQEASVIGSGYALRSEDWVLPALRESGVALLRGYSLSDYVNQCFGNGADVEKGRQMPCHYGHKAVNYPPLSSPIATQLPQAVGVALAMKARGAKACAIGYMGDGATSEADFHVAMEFAARLHAPVVLFCQNNQWAISTGWKQQTAAPSLACKAHGYGMDGYRVDGNDVLAVWDVTRLAAEKARAGGGPTFIEAFTYRVGAHSTSDDPSRYRDESITAAWKERDPIARFRRTIEGLGFWSQQDEDVMQADFEERIKREIVRAEAEAPPAPDTLFEDVYAEPWWRLREQALQLKEAVHG